MMVDGSRKSKKIMYFKNFSKTTRYFFLVASRPLRRVFKTFYEKNSKKNKIFIFCKKFRTIFFSSISRFFEVCSRGDLGPNNRRSQVRILLMVFFKQLRM